MAYTLTKEEEKFWLSQPDEPELKKDIEVISVSKEKKKELLKKLDSRLCRYNNKRLEQSRFFFVLENRRQCGNIC
ncbi:hypothetical protein [Streptococcus respiraculi]|uniref:hypothetical protein n=1 Tax=Streptococcus respiraculi TaxID=2021971 RepID=UPI000E71D5AC|nr:hypothetical protein [Streptococcus respiraculi]